MDYKNLSIAFLILLITGCTPHQPAIYKTTKTYPESLQQLHRNVIHYFLEDDMD